MQTHSGPQTTGKAHRTTAPKPSATAIASGATPASRAKPTISLAGELADVALIDAKHAAAVGGVGLSWWHGRVALGIAPQPVIREPRMTRWRLKDVAEFWRACAASAVHDSRVVEAARKGSAAARAAHARATAAPGA